MWKESRMELLIRRRKYLTTIYSKAVAMDQLIDELFLFSKLDLKTVPFSFEEVEIGRYLKDYIDELHFDLEEKGIRVDFRYENDHPVYVIADREKLRRVLFEGTGSTRNADTYFLQSIA
jgi:histidine kinase